MEGPCGILWESQGPQGPNTDPPREKISGPLPTFSTDHTPSALPPAPARGPPPAHRTRWSAPRRCGRCQISSSESPPSWRKPSRETSPGGAGRSSPAGVWTGGLRWGKETSDSPSPISRHPSPGPNLTLDFGVRPRPPPSLCGISWKKPKSPQVIGGGSGLGRASQAKGRGQPGNPWPLTLDPAAPVLPRGGRISLWGRWRSLCFPMGASASPEHRPGCGWSAQELRSPLGAPGPSPAPLAGPRPSWSHLLPPHLPETWWRRRRSPRGSALRARRPPTWARPSVRPPRRAGGGACGRLRPSSRPLFRFRFLGATGRAGSALAPPLLLRPEPGRAPGVCTLRRSAQTWGAGGGAASAVGHMSPRCAGSASSRPSWGRGRIRRPRRVSAPPQLALPTFLALSPPLPQEAGTDEDLGPFLALGLLPGHLLSLNLSLLVCKMGMIILATSWVCVGARARIRDPG